MVVVIADVDGTRSWKS